MDIKIIIDGKTFNTRSISVEEMITGKPYIFYGIHWYELLEQKNETKPLDLTIPEDADIYFESKIEDAKKDDEKSMDLYHRYVGNASNHEERKRRIQKFRCG